VHELGLERIEKASDGAELRQREPDRGIWRKSRRWNAQLTGRFSGAAGIARRNDGDLVAEFAQYIRDPGDHCRHAVDLRHVSVCYKCNSHERTIPAQGQPVMTAALRPCNGT